MRKFDSDFNTFLWGMVAGAILGLVVCTSILTKHPKAIDVYRGKTTLEMTYRDTIPVDTAVVFKNK